MCLSASGRLVVNNARCWDMIVMCVFSVLFRASLMYEVVAMHPMSYTMQPEHLQ